MNFDNLCIVFSLLDYKDLVACRAVCKLFRDVADREEYWRMQCEQHWIESPESLPPSDVSVLENDGWREYFIRKYKDFGRYISVYKRIKRAWDTIEKVMRIYHEDATGHVLPGISEEEMNAFERENNISLPLDYRCSMRIHCGETFRRDDVGFNGPPVLGVVQYYHVSRQEYVLPLRWSDTMRNQFPVFPDKTSRWGVVPLSMSKRNHLSPAFRTFQLLSVDEEKSGVPSGVVFYWVVKPHCDPIYLYHVSDNQPMETYVENAIRDELIPYHKIAYSYTQWLEELALKFTYNAEVGLGRMFDYMYTGYYFKPDWVLTTNHITVRIGIRFIPEESTMNWFWTYRVIFEMAEDAPPSASCMLQRRHWIITDAQGRTDVVDGEGVIGEYPKLTPGTVWSYSSCTHINTKSGKMGGFFTFQNRRSGDCHRITCPEFQLKIVPV